MAKKRNALTGGDRLEVWRKTNGHCHLCGEPLSDNGWEVDHIVPNWKGPDVLWNMLPACSICNGTKRSGVDMCVRLLVGKYAHTLIFKPGKLSQGDKELGRKIGEYIDKKEERNAERCKGEPIRNKMWQAARKGGTK